MKLIKQMHHCDEESPFEYCIGNVPMMCENIVRFVLHKTPRLIELHVSDEPEEGMRLVNVFYNDYPKMARYNIEGYRGFALGVNLEKLLKDTFGYRQTNLHFNIVAL